jgi:methionine-rich copper-binding protein CopC
MRGRGRAALVGAVVLTCAWQTGAFAHAKLLRAEPVPGSTVTLAPRVVRLVFALSPGEELDVQRSTVSVWDAGNRRVDDGKGGVDLDDLDRRTMIARLRPIGPGTYTVRWRAVSAPDLHVAQGSYRFTVARTTGGPRNFSRRSDMPRTANAHGNGIVGPPLVFVCRSKPRGLRRSLHPSGRRANGPGSASDPPDGLRPAPPSPSVRIRAGSVSALAATHAPLSTRSSSWKRALPAGMCARTRAPVPVPWTLSRLR